ncbi:MAG: SH3 domain-containing protein [Chloroflexi bacterium]|nr:SH3 domain-containing protein [Chloroflexota bacterium]
MLRVTLAVAALLLLAGCSSQPPPAATATVAPTSSPTVPTPTPAPPPQPALQLSPIASPSPTPDLTPLVVGKTDGEGVSIRKSPGTGDRIRAWPDGTQMTPLGDSQQADGRTWLKVRDPDNNEGWVAAEFLTKPATPTATLQVAPGTTPQTVAPAPTATLPAPTATFPPLRPTFTPPGVPKPTSSPAAAGGQR